MRPFKEIKAHYYFTKEDEERLLRLKPFMEKRVDRVVESLYQWINSTNVVKSVFKNESLIKHVMKLVREWFINLFSGKYDNFYYDTLIKIGQRHEKVGVESHFMNRAINIIRNACIDILLRKLNTQKEKNI